MHLAYCITMIVLLALLIGVSVYGAILAFRSPTSSTASHSSSDFDDSHHRLFAPRFLYLYNLGAQTGITGSISFDQQGYSSPGFIHALNTPNFTLAEKERGVYTLSYMVQPATGAAPANQFGIYVNDALVQGTVYGMSTFGTSVPMNATLRLYAGDVVSLRNVTGSSVNLAAGINQQVNAFLTVVKVSECD